MLPVYEDKAHTNNGKYIKMFVSCYRGYTDVLCAFCLGHLFLGQMYMM